MKGRLLIFGVSICAGILFFSAPGSVGLALHDYDILIKNGKVFDGSLRAAVKADVAVKDGRIVQVGENVRGTAVRVIDANGLVVTPGFIDLHTHVDRSMYFPENKACLNYLTQGVTTVVVGLCGGSGWPIFEKAEDQIYGIGTPHICLYSTFLYKIKEYAVQRKVVSLPHVVRSQTSLPAEIMEWKDRGWLKEGYRADIVVLGLGNIKINNTISNPDQYCEGVEYLLVNGRLAIDKGEWNGTLRGKVIRLKE